MEDSDINNTPEYELFYLSVANVGLSEDALLVRRQHEARGEKNVLTNLSEKYITLVNILEFLTTNHDFYSASKLVERAKGGKHPPLDTRSVALKMSYGGTGGGRSSALEVGVIVLAAVAIAAFLSKRAGGKIKL